MKSKNLKGALFSDSDASILRKGNVSTEINVNFNILEQTQRLELLFWLFRQILIVD